MDQPLVSVLMTAFNREKYVGEAIRSVLASTYEHFELVIADDSSTDNTVLIAKQYAAQDSRIRVVVNDQNLGDYANRNKAAALAIGEYLKYVDSDDSISSDCLQVMVDAMERFPAAGFGLVGKNLQPAIKTACLFSGEEAYKKYFFQCALLTMPPTGAIIRRTVFEQAGGFSGTAYIGDTELWLTLCQRYSVVAFPDRLVQWREHGEQQVHQGMENTFYDRETYGLHARFLTADHCPLQPDTAAIALRNQRNIYTRKALRLFCSFHFNKARRIFNSARISIPDFFYALKRNQVVP